MRTEQAGTHTYIYIQTHTYSLSHTHTKTEQLKVLTEIHILPKLIHTNNNNYKNGNNRR